MTQRVGPGQWGPTDGGGGGGGPSTHVLTVSAGTYTPILGGSYSVNSIATPAGAFTVDTPLGSPVSGDVVELLILTTGGAVGITWSSTYLASGTVNLPSTTTATKVICLAFQYDRFRDKWVLRAATTVGY